MKPKFLITLTLIAILLESCLVPLHYYNDLSEIKKNLIPYKKGEVYSFIDSTGIVFDATVTIDTTYLIMTEDAPDWFSYDQFRTVKMKSDYSNFDLTLTVSEWEIVIDIYSPVNLWIDLRIDEKGKFKTFTYNNDYQHFHNSLEINKKTYFDVVERFIQYVKIDENGNLDENGKLLSHKFSRTIFYNKIEGILQLLDEYKVIFTINN